MQVQNTRQRPVKLNLPNAAEFGGHFYIDGRLTLPMRRGQYTFELDAGPEYRTQSGHFEIDRHADDAKRIEMTRFADLAKEGWYGADLDVTRSPRDMPLILRAEGLQDIQIADFGLRIADSVSQSAIRKEFTQRGGQSEIQIARTPYAWNLPVWLASGKLDAIQLIHHHALRESVVDNEDDGRPRDRSLLPGRSGNGRWSETVYYHVLNCGLRIPPVAGSGSGTNDNPVGSNRVYVFCGDEFTPESWWDGLREGRVFVTNGPLLRPLVEGQPPGYVFHIDEGGSLSLEIGLNLATRVPVEYLEIIKNGEVYTDVRLADWTKKKGRLPPVEFDESGWFLVRAVTNNPKTYQFASSGPYYVEKGVRPRVSRRSVQFFFDWIAAAESRLRDMPKLDDATRHSLLAEQASAREFFAQLLSTANAE
ncbi:MAG: hypothetical protein L0228_12315 [Planctomycetes bacterium]|nr:hypothetical protein [Planctomycetota bacterium]